MDDKKIMRINELSRKKKENGLTPSEQQEQKELYREYLDNIKGNLKVQLDQAGIEQKNGSEPPDEQNCKCKH